MDGVYAIAPAVMAIDAQAERIDPETGEVLQEEPDYASLLDAVRLERQTKLENVACWIKNLTREADMIKAEREALAAREKAKRGKVEALKAWLSSALDGQKMESSRVSVTYRPTTAVEIDDEADFIAWAQHEDYEALLRYRPPEIARGAVRAWIKDGMDIPGARIATRQSLIIK